MFDLGFVCVFMIYMYVYIEWFLATWCLSEVLKSQLVQKSLRDEMYVCVCVNDALNLSSLINMGSTQNLTYKDTKIV
jgi:hypothetical protein